MFRRPFLLIFSALFAVCFAARFFGVSLLRKTPLTAAFSGEKTAASAVGVIDRITVTAEYERLQLTDCEVSLGGGEFLGTNGLLVYGDGFLDLPEGARVRITGDISAFDTPDNPGEFDRQSYYRTRGLDFVFYSDSVEIIEEDTRSFPDRVLGSLRQRLSESVDRVSADETEAGLFKAFFLGDKSGIDEEQYDLIRIGGAAHMLAISGLHLSLIGKLLLDLFKKLRLPPTPSLITADLILLLYVIMLDGSASAWRAYIMFSAAVFAPLLGRSYDFLSALGLAGTLLLLSAPSYVSDPAFLLSFSAAAGIGIIYPVLRGALGGLMKKLPSFLEKAFSALVFSVSIQLMTLPVTAYFYYSVPLYGMLVNIVMLPFLSLALVSVMAGAAAGVFSASIGGFFIGFAHYYFAVLLKICEWVGDLPFAVITTGKPAEWQIALYYVLLSAFLFLLRRWAKGVEKGQKRKLRKAAPALLALSLAVASLFHIGGGPSITALYVGQGDCSVITTEENHAVLIDCGSSSKKDVSGSVILPFLKSSGISIIDMIFLSHADGDHISGLSKLLSDSAIKVGMVCVSYSAETRQEWSEVAELAGKAGVPLLNLKTGDTAMAGGMTFEVLSPSEQLSADADKNERSMVVRMEYGDFSALFTGDIGELAEGILSDENDKTDCDYLKCPHHGSKYSSSEDFLQSVTPALTVISAGRNNSYGHPAPETLERLISSGSAVFSTDTSGAVTTRISSAGAGGGLTVSVINPRSP